jgi:hypothetical protein
MTQSNKTMSAVANQLANRILQGSNELAAFAEQLTDAEWKTPVIGDGRSIGVVVHHVASMYPLEVELTLILANGNPITGATKEGVDQINADHDKEFKNVGKTETLRLLKDNANLAAEVVRNLSDEELQNFNTISLNADAPLTCQFFVEDHPVRHSFHHLAKMRETLA